VVTAAAVVMVGVFGIFATLSMIDFKQMGIGLATAVLIDATIIRGVLLPASMKLLGDWNWYLPKWLEGLPQLAPEPAVGASVPAAAVVPTGEPSFDIDVERRNGDVRLSLRGEVDCDTCTALREELEELEAEQPDLLLIDLRGLSFMDSSGLRELVAAVRRGREEGRRVVLVKGSAPVDSVLAITRAEDAMETVEDPAAAGFGDLGRDG
jgi:anti-anti-sigma factor